MRKMALLFAVVMIFAGAVAMAGEGDHGKMKGKTHEVTAEIVSVDTENMTVTFKMDGEEKTAPVMKQAKEHMNKVKAGDMVVLTCMDTDEGEHEGVVKIEPASKKG